MGELRCLTVAELMKLGFPDTFHWGSWKLDANTLELVIYAEGFGEYRVDLEDMTSAKKVLDWIFHLEEKIWMTPEETKGFLRGVRLIFGRAAISGCSKLDVRVYVLRFLKSPRTAGEWAALEKLMASDFVLEGRF